MDGAIEIGILFILGGLGKDGPKKSDSEIFKNYCFNSLGDI
jgi:hypothetical protein